VTFITHLHGVVDIWRLLYNESYLQQIGFSCDFHDLNFRRIDGPFGLLFSFGKTGNYNQDSNPGNIGEMACCWGRQL